MFLLRWWKALQRFDFNRLEVYWAIVILLTILILLAIWHTPAHAAPSPTPTTCETCQVKETDAQSAYGNQDDAYRQQLDAPRTYTIATLNADGTLPGENPDLRPRFNPVGRRHTVQCLMIAEFIISAFTAPSAEGLPWMRSWAARILGTAARVTSVPRNSTQTVYTVGASVEGALNLWDLVQVTR